jgi:hypothetical protein
MWAVGGWQRVAKGAAIMENGNENLDSPTWVDGKRKTTRYPLI